MSERPQHVLLTGGTGCLGSRILDELLKDGYRVRATARPKKINFIKDTFPDAKPEQLEIFEMQDLVTADWKPALEGIDAVIHVATPVYHPWVTGQEIYDASTTGMKRLIDAVGESKNVKKFIYTGSIGAFFAMDFSNVLTNITFDENTWSELEDLDPKTTPDAGIYLGCKAISEKIMWRAAEKYKNIDFTSILTSCVYGAFLPTYPTPKEEDELNGNKFLYHLLKTKNRIFPPVPMTAVIHNRDNALAHVRALSVPPLEGGRKKRFIISSGDMKWDDAVRYLSEKRPEVRARLPDLEGAQLAREHFKLDTGLSEEYLGIGPGKVGEGEGGVIGWKEMLVESVDFILEWEKKMGITDA